MHAPGGDQEMLGDEALEEDMASKAAVEGKMTGAPQFASIRTLTDLHMRKVRLVERWKGLVFCGGVGEGVCRTV